jgi:hypothetical protein
MDLESMHLFRVFTLEDFMSFFTALVTSKIAAGILAGGIVAAGGTAAAAYSGTLPEPLQQTSHVLLGAPAPAAAAAAQHQPGAASHGKAPQAADGPDADSESKSEKESEPGAAEPVGPDATGPAAFGLCTAFTKGGLDPASTAYKSLATAAAGSADITAYCASVKGPGRSAEHRHANADGSGDSASPQNGTPPGRGDRGRSHKPAKAEKP